MDDVRTRVLTAATELFAELGYDGTSVQQVVVRAGVTKGALYHYYTSKEELLFEIYGSVIAEQLASLDRITALGLPPEATLRAIIQDVVETTAEHILATTVFGRESSRLNQEHWQTLRERWRRYQDTVRAVIRDAQTSGAFASVASPEIASWMIFGVTNSMSTWYRPDGPKKPTEIAQEICDLVFAGLRSPDMSHTAKESA